MKTINNINGIFLLDKPLGLSSNAVLQKVKRVLQVKKAGHTGSLDPLASGMLPICLNEATKFSQYLLDSDKTYAVTMQLGVRTTTSDAEGAVVSERPVPTVSLSDMDAAFDAFRGTTQQIPSMFSALKHNGMPLYEYARKGITIERASRPMTIYDLKVTSIVGAHVSFVVKCSKGTYVRTLVDDVGETIGCGAHVTLLRRLSVAHFSQDQMMTLEQLTDFIQNQDAPLSDILLPADSAVHHWPIVVFTADQVAALKKGQSVSLLNSSNDQWIRLVDESKQFFGVGEVLSDGVIHPRKLFSQMNNK